MNYSTDAEPAVDAAFSLARERMAAEDEQRRDWLQRHMDRPDPDEFEPVPEFKTHPPADGRCRRWSCHRKVRCKGLCARHYFTMKSQERRARAA